MGSEADLISAPSSVSAKKSTNESSSVIGYSISPLASLNLCSEPGWICLLNPLSMGFYGLACRDNLTSVIVHRRTHGKDPPAPLEKGEHGCGPDSTPLDEGGN